METTILIILHLTSAHIIGDFLFQTDSLAEYKKKSLIGMTLHVAIVAVTTWGILGSWTCWQVLVIVGLSHFVIDIIKRSLTQRYPASGALMFLVDQTIHIVTLALIGVWLESMIPATALFWFAIFGIPFVKVVVLIAGAVAVTKSAGHLMSFLIRPYLNQLDKQAEERGLENGGKMIGLLERGLLYLFIIAGSFEMAGFMLAAKSIFRFGDLTNSNDRKETEYVIIGTMMSFALALLIGIVTRYVVFEYLG